MYDNTYTGDHDDGQDCDQKPALRGSLFPFTLAMHHHAHAISHVVTPAGFLRACMQ